MLYSWPIVAFFLFQRMPPQKAIIWSVLGAYMLLPTNTGFDPPLIPPLDKTLVANLTVALMCAMLLRGRLSLLPKSFMGKVLVAMFVSAPFFTVMTNQHPVFWGVRVLPPLTMHDAFSLLVRQVIVIMPFFVGRQYLATEDAHRTLLWALVLAGLIYSFPMLLEVRLSPQLHNWVYGFFPHSFAQMVRFGGFRPVVFMEHGLWVALFAATTVVAAGAAWRAKKRFFNLQPSFITIYLAIVLVLCKTFGAAILAAIGLLFVRFAKLRFQLLFCVIAAATALAYPTLRGADLIPTTDLVSFVQGINAERAESLQFRFKNEDVLLEHASNKPIFGWGTFARNRVFDPNTGANITTADGKWVITIGVWGWYGYIAEFGLITLPVFLLWLRARRRGNNITLITVALCVIHSINLLDLLPNATFTPVTLLVAGALFGYTETKPDRRRPGTGTAPNGAPPGPVNSGPPPPP